MHHGDAGPMMDRSTFLTPEERCVPGAPAEAFAGIARQASGFEPLVDSTIEGHSIAVAASLDEEAIALVTEITTARP